MSTFSGLLEKYIRRCGYTNQHFAVMSGVDRTLLQKYIAGQRIPSSREIFEKIAVNLRLSPEEFEELDQAYQKVVLGEERYEQFRIIKDILEQFEGRKDNPGKRFLAYSRLDLSAAPVNHTVRGRNNILHWIWNILTLEAAEENSELHLICQPGIAEFDGMLQGCLQSSNTRVHHLVCINPGMESGGAENLRLLQALLPMLCLPVHYDLRFYYGIAREHFNAMSLMPNLLISSSFVVQFDQKMTRAVISSDCELNSHARTLGTTINETVQAVRY